MSTTLAAPPVAPVTPSAPAAPAAAPAKPANVNPPAPATTSPAEPPKPAPSLDDGLKALADKSFVAPAPAAPVESRAAEPAKPTEPGKAEPAAAPAETDIFAHIKQPELKTEESKAGWKALKKEAAAKVTEAEKKYTEAMAQLEIYKKATPADTAEAERTKAELKAARDALAVYDLKRDPDFQRQYIEPKSKALTEAKQLLTDNAIEGAPEVADLLGKSRTEFAKTVSELAAKMPAFDQGSFVASMREAYRLHGEENGALAKSAELKQSLEAKRAQNARMQFEKTRDEIKQKVPVLQIPEGASEEVVAEFTDYNQSVQAALAEAETNSFSKITEADVARISHEAAMLKPMSKLFRSIETKYKAATDLNRQLLAELEGIKKAKSPGQFTGGQGGSDKPDLSKMPIEAGLKALGNQIFRQQ